MKRVSWPEVKDRLSEFVLVDVRPKWSFAEGSLAGAVNLPLEEIAKGGYELKAERPLLVFCNRGQRSAMAGLYLEADGYEVYLLEGGLASLPPEEKKAASMRL